MQIAVRKRVYAYGAVLGGSILLMLFFLYVVLPGVMNYFAWRLPENFEFISDELVKKGETERAVKILQAASEKRPWDFRPRHKLGMILLKSGQKQRGIDHLEQAARLAFSSTAYPDMLSPYHRKRLANLYFNLASAENAARQDKPEMFYFTYAALLDQDYARKSEAVFRSLLERKELSLSQVRALLRFYSLTGREKGFQISLERSLEALEAADGKDKWSPRPPKGLVPLTRPSDVKESQNLTSQGDIGIFFKEGYAKYELTWKRGMDTKLWILAWGTPAFGIYPILELRVDGKRSGFLYVGEEKPLFYPVMVSIPAGRHTITVSYPNDGGLPGFDKNGEVKKLVEDRNLFFGGLFVQVRK